LGQFSLYAGTDFAQFLNEKISAILAKILITPLTMICNFIVLKNIVEKI